MSDDSLVAIRTVSVTRVGPSGILHTQDRAAAEEPLDVRLHGRSFAIIMRTPGNERMFVLVPGRHPARETRLVELLAGQGIEVFRADEAFSGAHVEASSK